MAHFAPPQRRRPRGLLVNATLALGLLFALALGAVVEQSIVQRRSPGDVMGAYFQRPPQVVFGKDRLAVLLLGIDYNYDAKDQPSSASARSDTIMALSLTFPSPQAPNGSVAVLSIPRDTGAVLPSGREDKINAAYALGGPTPAGEARSSEKAVADFLGLPGFDRYVTLRINATKDLVDALGGIDVVPDETMDYDDSWGHLHIHFKGGRRYHMNGEQAVSYSRFRHDACSDPCRIKRQQQVLRIALAKLKNDKFNDVLHAGALLGVMRRNVYTDFSDGELLSLAGAFRNFDVAALKTEQVPFTGDKTLACCGDVLIADDSAKGALVRKFFFVGAAAAAQAIAPASVHVAVQNGSGVVGVGKKLAAELRRLGFAVDGVGDAATFGYDATEIVVAPAARAQAERVRTALGLKGAVIASTAPVTAGAAGIVTVIVGRDFAGSSVEASAVK
jgi:LCP family protein required for cell wall assembly